MRLGIRASERPFVEHLEPIWQAIAAHERCVWDDGLEWFQDEGEDPTTWLAAAPRELRLIFGSGAERVAFMDHGTGLQWYGHAGRAAIAKASLIMAPNDFMAARYRQAFPTARIVVIGTPKMDGLSAIDKSFDYGLPTLAVSFHWTGDRLHPRPIERFEADLLDLAASDDLQLLGHAHPRIWPAASKWYVEHGIEPVETFAEVVARADVYACDHSSTIYEWAALDRPVILLDVGETGALRTTGLRYSEHEDIGWHASPKMLAEMFETALDLGPRVEAESISAELYPYIGSSTERAVAALRSLDAA